MKNKYEVQATLETILDGKNLETLFYDQYETYEQAVKKVTDLLDEYKNKPSDKWDADFYKKFNKDGINLYLKVGLNGKVSVQLKPIE